MPNNAARILLLLCSLLAILPRVATAQESRDGQRDFDWEIGTWKTHVKRLQRPLTGSTTWVEYHGTSVVRSILDGRANQVELDVTGPAGRIAGLSLRLYDPESRQWSLNFANLAGGTLSPPTIGEFRDGRGEFYAQETLNGRPIRVRFVIACESADLCRFEQAFSGNGGRNWELNWIATDTRIAHAGQDTPPQATSAPDLSGLDDFDFLIGEWRVHSRRLKERLVGSQEWTEFDGSIASRKLMDGFGNVDDTVFNMPEGVYRGVAPRAYDPKTGEWAIWWIDARNPHGALDPPVKGRFVDGIGTFYADDRLRGMPIRVRFAWSGITRDSARWEQAFSADGGKTWEVNWTQTLQRVR